MRRMTGLLLLSLALSPLAARAQAPQADVQKTDALLKASKYTANRVNNAKVAVWTIARTGNQIGDFQVVVTTDKGLVIAFVTVAEKKNIRRTPELVEKVLQINHDLDYVKVGFDDDDDLFVRIDANLRIVDVEEMNSIITQVGNTADAAYSAVKPYLSR